MGGLLLALAGSAGCASGGGLPAGSRVDAAEPVGRLREATRPRESRHAVFSWRYRDRNARFSGRGSARIAPGYRIRIDLFTGDGTTALRAAVVEGELRLPPGADPEIALPPPALLWAALGVLQPEPAARLRGAWRTDGGLLEVRYGLPAGEDAALAFGIEGERIVWATHRARGHEVERVDVGTKGEHGLPREARYRDLRRVRELTIDVESVERTHGFSEDIWYPGR